MLKFILNLRNILPLTTNSFIPAIIFGVGLIGFYANEHISEASMLSLHWMFYILGFLSIIILIYFNQSKPLMFIVITVISYMLINILKTNLNTSYSSSPYYINLCLLAPLNLITFYYAKEQKLFNKENLYIILSFFIQIAIFEALSSNGIALGYNIFSSNIGTINELSFLTFTIGALAILISASKDGGIQHSYLLFAFIEIIFGFIYSDNSSALTIFFGAALLTSFIGLTYDLFYSTFKDNTTGLSSRNSFLIQAKTFPMKYSVGIISIDDYNRLYKIFGKNHLNNIVKMVATKITEHEKDNPVYRYSTDEFIIIFKNENRNDSFDRMEQIRRSIAGSEFVLSKRKKPIKLTISGSVSEKKRSDANAFEALIRAHKTLEKTNKFSQNITSKA